MLYQYQCKSCNNEYEELCTVAERNSQPCPKCKSTDVERPYIANLGHGDTFKGVMVEHLHDEPTFYSSKIALKKACRKLGVTCGLVD